MPLRAISTIHRRGAVDHASGAVTLLTLRKLKIVVLIIHKVLGTIESNLSSLVYHRLKTHCDRINLVFYDRIGLSTETLTWHRGAGNLTATFGILTSIK